MNHVRDELYEKYVSAFKGDPHATFDVPRFEKWCDAKIGPWLCDVPPDSAVLELGCGPGYLLDYLRRKGYANVWGIDRSAEQIEVARGRGCVADVGDVFEVLGERRGAYDLILAIDFLEHFSVDEGRRLVAHVRHALRPGGRLVLQTPNGQGFLAGQVIYGDLTHETIYNPGSLRQLLTVAGYGNIEFRECGPAAIDIKGWARTVAWRLIKLGINVASKVANGRTDRIWTDNMLCLCRATGEGYE